MRDFIVLSIVIPAALYAYRHPWVGVMLWTWRSIMNPHRYPYGIAYGAPVAAVAAIATFSGLLMTKDEKVSPFKGAPVVVFALFMGWMTVSWLMGLDIKGDYIQWTKVMKIDLMVLVGLMVLHSKKHVIALAWVSAGSLALLGVKGGIFTLLGGGAERVWGPPGSFIEDNNEFGLALIMTIPIVRFLQLQVRNAWGKRALLVAMLLCATAALGTQSRGALLAISAMALLLWWRSRNRFVGGALILLTSASLLSFMPESWFNRMHTIDNYQQDGSALGRLSAWSNAWHLAFDYPFGVGFNAGRQELFDKYSSAPEVGARAAHSIYFQVLGNHGFGGLALFLLFLFLTWRCASWLRTHASRIPEAHWCADLGAMVQVSLMGYLVGGAFLSLAYFDLPYDLMIMVVVARVWVTSKAWTREPVYPPGWRTLPGLLTPPKPG